MFTGIPSWAEAMLTACEAFFVQHAESLRQHEAALAYALDPTAGTNSKYLPRRDRSSAMVLITPALALQADVCGSAIRAHVCLRSR